MFVYVFSSSDFMKIRLNNNKELDILVVNASTQYFQGAARDVLDIQLEKGKYSFDEIEEYFSDENITSKIYIIDDETNEYLYTNYSLRIKLGIINTTNELNSKNTENDIERLSIQMAQKTYQEILLKEIRQTVDILVLSNLEDI